MAAAAGYYPYTIINERKKRKQIKAWEQDRLATIQEVSAELHRRLANPDIDFVDTLIWWKEQREFLNLITHPSTMF